MRIVPDMHEMSIVSSLFAMIGEEMAKHGMSRLVAVRVRHGVLANVVPESMEMAFEVLIEGTPFAGARLELDEEPLVLACGDCGLEFAPPGPLPFYPCPHCGFELAHRVVHGKELYLDHLEAE